MAGTDRAEGVLVLYWGRRGAGSRMLLDLIEAANGRPGVFFSFARDNEIASSLQAAASDPLIVRTFARAAEIALTPIRLPAAFISLIRYCRRHRIARVINLMPHVWTGLGAPIARAAGLGWATVVHEITAHPGDRTGLAHRLLRLELHTSTRILTLSGHVRDVLAPLTGEAKLAPVIPLYAFGSASPASKPEETPPGAPLRFLFFGRIMRYKGLEDLVSAAEGLAAEGRDFSLSIVGEGPLGPLEPRLRRLNAVIDNRWIAHEEIPALFQAHDVVIMPTREASQSGVAATAHGCGTPVIATPVGALPEQIEDGVDGLICAAVGAQAVAGAMRRVMEDPELLAAIRTGAEGKAAKNGPARFLDRLLSEAAGPEKPDAPMPSLP